MEVEGRGCEKGISPSCHSLPIGMAGQSAWKDLEVDVQGDHTNKTGPLTI